MPEIIEGCNHTDDPCLSPLKNTGGVHATTRYSDRYTTHLPLPHAETLVVRCADEASVLVHEGDGVHGAQVTVILLHHLARPDVPLVEREINKVMQNQSGTKRKNWGTCDTNDNEMRFSSRRPSHPFYQLQRFVYLFCKERPSYR